MTIINRGNQKLTFDFKSPAKGSNFNKLLFPLVKPGIYKGLNVSLSSGNKVNISPGHLFINCIFESQNVRGTTVEFQTAIVDLEINQSTVGFNEILYVIFEYKETINNFVDFKHISVGGILPTNALILAELEYDSSGNIINILTEKRDYGFFSYESNYSIPDINTNFSSYTDGTKKFKFNASEITTDNQRTISIPDYDYSLGTIDNWVSARKYNIREVVVFNNTLYRCLVSHISSLSFFTDLLNWENITKIEDEEKTRGFNNSGLTLFSYRVVIITGDNSFEKIPEIDLISNYSQEPYGIVVSDILTGTSGEVIQRGRIVVTGVDLSSGIVGQKVYSDSNGNLTLTITPLMVGQLIFPDISNSVIYVGILPSEEGINSINFNGQLATNENTIQKAFDRLDDYGYIPNWSSGQEYRLNNVVSANGNIYRCIVVHTSGATFNSNNWTIDQTISVSGFNGQFSSSETTIQKAFDRLDDYDYIPNWSSGQNYRIGNAFVNNEVPYITIASHISSNFLSDLNSGNIKELKHDEILINNIVSSNVSGIVTNLNVSGTSYVRLVNVSLINLSGIIASTEGCKYLTITNSTGNQITIGNEIVGASASDRILTGTGGDLKLKNNSSINLIYDTITSRWRIVGGSGTESRNESFYFVPSKPTANLSPGEYNNFAELIIDIKEFDNRTIYFPELLYNLNIQQFDLATLEFISTLNLVGVQSNTNNKTILNLNTTGSTFVNCNSAFFKKIENLRLHIRGFTLAGNKSETSIINSIIRTEIGGKLYVSSAFETTVWHLYNSQFTSDSINSIESINNSSYELNTYSGYCSIQDNIFDSTHNPIALVLNNYGAFDNVTNRLVPILGTQSLSNITVNNFVTSEQVRFSPTGTSNINSVNVRDVLLEINPKSPGRLEDKGWLLTKSGGGSANLIGLPPGTNNQVLISDNATVTGLKWGTVLSGGASFQVTQANNFARGTPIFYHSSVSGWQPAQASGIASVGTAIVTTTGNPFTATIGGEVNFTNIEITNLIGAPEFVPGAIYYTSNTQAGKLVNLSPTISNPMLRAISPTRAIIQPGFVATNNSPQPGSVVNTVISRNTHNMSWSHLGLVELNSAPGVPWRPSITPQKIGNRIIGTVLYLADTHVTSGISGFGHIVQCSYNNGITWVNVYHSRYLGGGQFMDITYTIHGGGAFGCIYTTVFEHTITALSPIIYRILLSSRNTNTTLVIFNANFEAIFNLQEIHT